MSNKETYWYIRAWGNFLGSGLPYILQQVELARTDNAPPTAIYRADAQWVTFEEIGRLETKEKIGRMVEVAKARATELESR